MPRVLYTPGSWVTATPGMTVMLEVRGVQAHACVRTGKHGYPVVGVGCMRRDDGAASVRRGLPPSLDAASVPQLQPCEGPFSDPTRRLPSAPRWPHSDAPQASDGWNGSVPVLLSKPRPRSGLPNRRTGRCTSRGTRPRSEARANRRDAIPRPIIRRTFSSPSGGTPHVRAAHLSVAADDWPRRRLGSQE